MKKIPLYVTIADNFARLRWEVPSELRNSVSFYNVYERVKYGWFVLARTSVSEYEMSALEYGKTELFRVEACGSRGDVIAASDITPVISLAAPNLYVSDVGEHSAKLLIDKVAGATGYSVRYTEHDGRNAARRGSYAAEQTVTAYTGQAMTIHTGQLGGDADYSDFVELSFSTEHAMLSGLTPDKIYSVRARAFARIDSTEHYSPYGEAKIVRPSAPALKFEDVFLFLTSGSTTRAAVFIPNMGGDVTVKTEDGADGAYRAGLVFDSTDYNVATVDKFGIITARSKGTAVITCSVEGGQSTQTYVCVDRDIETVSRALEQPARYARSFAKQYGNTETASGVREYSKQKKTAVITIAGDILYSGAAFAAPVEHNGGVDGTVENTALLYTGTDKVKAVITPESGLITAPAEAVSAKTITAGISDISNRNGTGADIKAEYHRENFARHFNGLSRVFENSDFSAAGLMSFVSPSMPFSFELPYIDEQKNTNCPASLLAAIKKLGIDCLFPVFADYSAAEGAASNAVSSHASADTFDMISRARIGVVKNSSEISAGTSNDTNDGTYIVNVNGIRVALLYLDDSSSARGCVHSVRKSVSDGNVFIIARVKSYGITANLAQGTISVLEEVAEAGVDYVIGESRIKGHISGNGVPPLRYYRYKTTDGRSVPVWDGLGALYSDDVMYSDGAAVRITLTEEFISDDMYHNGDGSARLSVSEECYFPVHTFREYRHRRFVACPLIPERQDTILPRSFAAVCGSIRRAVGKFINVYGEHKLRPNKRVFVAGSELSRRVIKNAVKNVVVDNANSYCECCGLSPLTLFAKPSLQAAETAYGRNGDIRIRHNIGKDVSDIIRGEGYEYAVFDLYAAAAYDLINADGFWYTDVGLDYVDGTGGSVSAGIQGDSFSPWGSYCRRVRAAELTPEIWQPLLDRFIDELTLLFPVDKIILIEATPPRIYTMRERVRVAKFSKEDELLTARIQEMERYFLSRVNCVFIDIAKYYFGDAYTYDTSSPVTFDTYFYEHSRKIIGKLLTDGHTEQSGRVFALFNEPDIWLRRYLYYSDSANEMRYATKLLDFSYAADFIVFYAGNKFVRIYFEKFIEIKKSGFRSITEVLDDYCEHKGLLREGVAAIHSVITDTYTDSDLDFSCIFDFNFAIVDVLIPKLEQAVVARGIAGGVHITSETAGFYLDTMRYVQRTGDTAGAAYAVANFNKMNRPATIDIWGSGVSAHILQYCKDVVIKSKLFRNPFIYAFDEPLDVDDKTINKYLAEYSREYVENVQCAFHRKALDSIKEDCGDWIVLDFFDLAMRNIHYHGQSCIVDKFSLSTPLSAFLLENGGEVFDICERYDRDATFAAIDKTAEFLKVYYGSNIILNRIELKEDYLDLSGKVKQFKLNRRIIRRTSEIIRECEDYFAERTRCYSIDIAQFFMADDKYPLGGANFAHYEALFYENSAYFIHDIIKRKPYERAYTALNPAFEAREFVSRLNQWQNGGEKRKRAD